MAPTRPSSDDDLVESLQIDDVMAATRGAKAANPHGGKQGLQRVGRIGVAEHELDVRAGTPERDRAGSEQDAAQERSPIAGRGVDPLPGPELVARDLHHQVMPSAGMPATVGRGDAARRIHVDAQRAGEQHGGARRRVIERAQAAAGLP